MIYQKIRDFVTGDSDFPYNPCIYHSLDSFIETIKLIRGVCGDRITRDLEDIYNYQIMDPDAPVMTHYCCQVSLSLKEARIKDNILKPRVKTILLSSGIEDRVKFNVNLLGFPLKMDFQWGVSMYASSENTKRLRAVFPEFEIKHPPANVERYWRKQ